MKRVVLSPWLWGLVAAFGNPLWLFRSHEDLSRTELGFDWFVHGFAVAVFVLIVVARVSAVVGVGSLLRAWFDGLLAPGSDTGDRLRDAVDAMGPGDVHELLVDGERRLVLVHHSLFARLLRDADWVEEEA